MTLDGASQPFRPPWLTQPFAVVDGGLATALELLGHTPSGLLWTAALVAEQPEVIVAAHRSFVEAGADIVITSSYQASVKGFIRAGFSATRAAAALASTTELARRAGAPFVAASIGPFGATLGDGSEYHGRYQASWPDIRRFHRERIQVLAATSPDMFAIETIPSTAEALIVMEELAAATSIPAWLTFSCRDSSSTCAGEPFGAAVAAVADRIGDQLVAVGVNCTAPVHVSSLLRLAGGVTDRPLVVYPNRGRAWDSEHRCWLGVDGVGDDGPAEYAPEWVALGVRLLGGCCGIGPDGIRSLVAVRSALACQP